MSKENDFNAQHQEPAVQARPCPKDCRRCSMQQQVCCASMLSFRSFDVMNSILLKLDTQSLRISELEERLKNMQGGDTELSAPIPFQDDLFPIKEHTGQ